MSIPKYIGSLITVSLLFSCTKSKSPDIMGETDVKFFTNNPAPGNAPDNSINYNVVNYPNPSAGGLLNLSANVPGTIKFPIFSTKPVSEDVTIGAALDTSLIAKYNAAHNTSYVAFPAGLLNTSGLIAHISKGSTTSLDSMIITSDLTILNSLTEKTYMAPIKLTTVSNAAVGAITNNTTTRITYVVMNMELRRIKYLATTADVLGSLLMRTAWAAIFNPAPTTVGSVLDGSTATFSRWVASQVPPNQLDVDMQAVKNVTGIRLLSSTSATYVPTQIEVSLSSDGINYDVIGSPLKANLTYASSYNYILFYKAIPARYIRLKLSYITNTNTQNYRVVEFDVYAN